MGSSPTFGIALATVSWYDVPAMRIGILTSGGDVPGLNPCIKAVVNSKRTTGTR